MKLQGVKEPDSDPYTDDLRYCGATTVYEGWKIVCWRNADHDGPHQGEVNYGEATYSWVT